MKLSTFPLSMLASLVVLSAAPALAQTSWPVKPIRLIVPYPPGGGNDTLARIFGQKLGESLGQQIIVENRAGAGTTIGTAFASRATPDGYTLLLSSIATHAFSPHLYAKPGYDALRDFSPVNLAGGRAYAAGSQSGAAGGFAQGIDRARQTAPRPA